jgi:8-oxo-dGTP pyrophosphatase MutT (NUDIX family)
MNFRVEKRQQIGYNGLQSKGGSAMSVVTFYRGDPNAPKPTQGAHLGANAVITCGGKLLLEKRADCDLWGLVGGGVKKYETELQAIVREVYEELGLRIPAERFRKLGVYGEPGRIAAYRDGSIWRMVVVGFGLELDTEPEMVVSRESKALRFFSREELKKIDIVVTHSDIVADWFGETKR